MVRCVLFFIGFEKFIFSEKIRVVCVWLIGYCINLVWVRYLKLLWIEVEIGVVLICLVGWFVVLL